MNRRVSIGIYARTTSQANAAQQSLKASNGIQHSKLAEIQSITQC